MGSDSEFKTPEGGEAQAVVKEGDSSYAAGLARAHDLPGNVTDEEIDAAPVVAAAEPVIEAAVDGSIGSATVFTGQLLRRLREERGISLKEISEHTKIGVPSLSAIEEERYDDLPNARIYVRGFVRCIAQELGLSTEQVAESYLPRWDVWHEAQKEKPKHKF